MSNSSSVTHSPQNTKADFPIPVEVGVKSDLPRPRGHEFHPWGHEGVGGGEPHQEVKEPTLVGRVKRTRYQYMELGMCGEGSVCVRACVCESVCVCVCCACVCVCMCVCCMCVCGDIIR